MFHQSREIACYLATNSEFDSSAIIQTIWHAKKKCYLPILLANEKHLEFVAYQKKDELALNRHKILEPVVHQKIATEKLDLVLLPLIGFDLRGNRLGTGGGYYDRTFQFLLTKKISKPILIGVGYQFQCVESLLHDAWDIPLNGVLTEKNIIFF